jgi:hypothetical protein
VAVQSNSFELGLPSRRRSKSDSMDGRKGTVAYHHMNPSTGRVQSLWLLASCNFGPETDALAKVVDELNALPRCSAHSRVYYK